MKLPKKFETLLDENVINIYIVDDNTTFTLALKGDIETSFANKPIKIYSFAEANTCMQKFTEVKPQIVILDYHMDSKNPKAADGIKLLDWIKKENEDTNVIMLTSDDHIDIAIKSFKHGASDYIVKSETQSVKIKNSLLNVFKIMTVKGESKRYQQLFSVLAVSIGLLVGGLGATWKLAPWLLH